MLKTWQFGRHWLLGCSIAREISAPYIINTKYSKGTRFGPGSIHHTSSEPLSLRYMSHSTCRSQSYCSLQYTVYCCWNAVVMGSIPVHCVDVNLRFLCVFFPLCREEDSPATAQYPSKNYQICEGTIFKTGNS
jgi:hypothetical protein